MAVSAFLAWAGFLALKALPAFFGRGTLMQNAWGLVCVLGLLQCLHMEKTAPQWRTARPMGALRYAGQISYSLYAVHPPAIMATSWALERFPAARSNTVQLGLTFLATALLTAATYWFIERPYLLRTAQVRPAAKPA